MKKIYFLIAMVTATMLASCTKEQEDFFSDSSANRADATIAADTKVLTSAANGWLMKLYPDAQQSYGGYNVIVRFKEDGRAEVMGEFLGDVFTSLYSVTQSAGIVLTFDTFNEEFHLFSDPSAPLGGDEGEGLGGDYDFSIMKATPEEVVLKGKNTGNRIVMTPMPNDDWAGYMNKIFEVEENMLSNFYQVKINNVEVPASISDRTLVFSYEENGEEVEKQASYIVTPEGIEFYEPLEIDGATMTGFKNGAEGALVFDESAGSGLKLEKVKLPEVDLMTNSDCYVAYSMLGEYAQQYWAAMAKAEAAVGESVGYAYFSYADGFYTLEFYSSGYRGHFYFELTPISDNEVTLKLISYDGNGQWYYKNAGWNYAVAPFMGTFKLSSDNEYCPSVLILQDVENPANTITLSLSTVYYPFNK